MIGFKQQAYRWTKGSFQTAIKLLPRILRSPSLPRHVKVEAFFHREVADAAAQSGNVSDLHRLWRGTCWSGDMLVGYGEGASAEEALGIAVTHGLEVVQGGPRQEEAEAKEEAKEEAKGHASPA